MSKAYKYNPSVARRPTFNNQSFAIHAVGLGYYRAFSHGKSNMCFIFVATNYFSKWIEAKPFLKIEAVDAIGFVKMNILYRFKVSKGLAIDNGS